MSEFYHENNNKLHGDKAFLALSPHFCKEKLSRFIKKT